MTEKFDLQRFVNAQASEEADYYQALQEIRNGRKWSHWIWYVFPQMKGLGHSYYSEFYGISGLDEAKAYYEHTVLGPRLIEITEALLEHNDKSAEDILGSIDALKVKSCMTLFWLASSNPLFHSVLDAFYDGQPDPNTMKLLGLSVKK